MQSIELLGPFIGKVVVDITEHVEMDQSKNNETFIQITFDDDSWVRFPRYEKNLWFSRD